MTGLRMVWGTDYRGPLVIVSATPWDFAVRAVCNVDPYRSALLELRYGRSRLPPVGCMVGSVVLVDCRCVNPEDDVEDRDDILSYRVMVGHDGRLRYDWHFRDAKVCVPTPVERQMGLSRYPVSGITFEPANGPRSITPEMMGGTIYEIGERLLTPREARS